MQFPDGNEVLFKVGKVSSSRFQVQERYVGAICDRPIPYKNEVYCKADNLAGIPLVLRLQFPDGNEVYCKR